MNAKRLQRGMSIWQLSIVIGVAGVFGIVGFKSFPVYLNEFKIKQAVVSVSQDASVINGSARDIQRALQKRWDIEDIGRIKATDVKIQRAEGGGKALVYEYEAVEHLFYNISLLIEFKGHYPLGGD